MLTPERKAELRREWDRQVKKPGDLMCCSGSVTGGSPEADYAVECGGTRRAQDWHCEATRVPCVPLDWMAM